MDDHTAGADPDRSGDGPSDGCHEPVGSLGDEAVKLLGAAYAWAQEQDQAQQRAPDSDARDARCVSCGSATRDGPCTWCPICKAAGFAHAASPELRAAVRSSVVSLTQLARTLLDSLEQRPQPSRGPSQRAGGAGRDVQHIDLAEDEGGSGWG